MHDTYALWVLLKATNCQSIRVCMDFRTYQPRKVTTRHQQTAIELQPRSTRSLRLPGDCYLQTLFLKSSTKYMSFNVVRLTMPAPFSQHPFPSPGPSQNPNPLSVSLFQTQSYYHTSSPSYLHTPLPHPQPQDTTPQSPT